MPTRQIFNARTQSVEDAELSVDEKSHEILATFADESFVKFPPGLDADTFSALIAAHFADNKGQRVITPEQEAAEAAEYKASLALIGVVDASDDA